ncbi:glycosyltransferase family 2 protein [Marinimicrobium sp. C2-29]|uniref:glycosyltransferase family 2 protein n=1 Tax=Marinimicrobium sp. C2-29 TaxID=3139825 RepID=UPI00313A29F2
MIVIPMAGLSSRFKDAGYELPKYMLEAKGKTLFELSVDSFSKYFNSETFLFVALDVYDTSAFINQKCQKLGICDYTIVILDAPTRGQAETVYLGLNALSLRTDVSITIFNIDTFRPDFRYPKEFSIENVDGYLETFVGSGANWSNVLPEIEHGSRVVKTAEKQEISNYCCTGIYYWKSAKKFMALFESYQSRALDDVEAGEYYIAPMYNDLIADGGEVHFSVIDSSEVIFCGVPSEYVSFKKN